MSTFTKLNNVRVCKRCGKPIEGRGLKYCTPCSHINDSIRTKSYMKTHKAYYKKAGPLCTCCGKKPIAPGNRFLCGLCFEWDGDEWQGNTGVQWRRRRHDREGMENGEAIRTNNAKPNTPSLAPSLIA